MPEGIGSRRQKSKPLRERQRAQIRRMHLHKQPVCRQTIPRVCNGRLAHIYSKSLPAVRFVQHILHFQTEERLCVLAVPAAAQIQFQHKRPGASQKLFRQREPAAANHRTVCLTFIDVFILPRFLTVFRKHDAPESIPIQPVLVLYISCHPLRLKAVLSILTKYRILHSFLTADPV